MNQFVASVLLLTTMASDSLGERWVSEVMNWDRFRTLTEQLD